MLIYNIDLGNAWAESDGPRHHPSYSSHSNRYRQPHVLSNDKQKPSQEDMLLVQSIQITDKFGFDRQQQTKSSLDNFDEHNESVFISSETIQGFCVNAIGKLRNKRTQQF